MRVSFVRLLSSRLANETTFIHGCSCLRPAKRQSCSICLLQHSHVDSPSRLRRVGQTSHHVCPCGSRFSDSITTRLGKLHTQSYTHTHTHSLTDIMEASSPLAALHRPMPVHGWGRDIFRPHSAFITTSSGTLSLREQLHKSTADYFNVKDIRGSSPAASLAADLSQNFRLDNDGRLVALCWPSLLQVANLASVPTSRRLVGLSSRPTPSAAWRDAVRNGANCCCRRTLMD